jgi:hypothetical protein
VPGFIICLVVAVAISLADEPNPEILAEYTAYKKISD